MNGEAGNSRKAWDRAAGDRQGLGKVTMHGEAGNSRKAWDRAAGDGVVLGLLFAVTSQEHPLTP